MDFFNQVPAEGSGPQMGPNGEQIVAQVKCGKLLRDGKKFTPDDRKGVLRVCKADELTHLQWSERSVADPEDDLIIFPQEAMMQVMPQPGCFFIRFPEDKTRNMFFWVQEPKGTFDMQEIATKVNNGLNPGMEDNGAEQAQLLSMAAAEAAAMPPPAAPSAPSATPAPAATTAGTDATPAAVPGAPAPTPSAPAKPPGESTATPGTVSSSALQGAFANLGGTPGGATPGGTGVIDAATMAAALAGADQRNAAGAAAAAGPGLSDILTPDTIGPLLQSAEVRSRLLDYLPEDHRASQDLQELVRTPQFQNQLARFSHALQSGQMDLRQFGLDPNAAGFSVAEFLQAIQSQVDATGGSAEGAGDQGGDAMQE